MPQMSATPPATVTLSRLVFAHGRAFRLATMLFRIAVSDSSISSFLPAVAST
jgi:hypothetical protein